LPFPEEAGRRLDEARRALGLAEFSAAWAEGRAMTPEEAAANALEPPQ
jgi:hypothetical protein